MATNTTSTLDTTLWHFDIDQHLQPLQQSLRILPMVILPHLLRALYFWVFLVYLRVSCLDMLTDAHAHPSLLVLHIGQAIRYKMWWIFPTIIMVSRFVCTYNIRNWLETSGWMWRARRLDWPYMVKQVALPANALPYAVWFYPFSECVPLE